MKKKGFTLVELLAVIAILAVLVIIALPNVLKLFRNAKENTFTSEVQNLVRSAEDKYLTSSLSSGNNTCFDSKTNPLDMSGRNNINYLIKLTNKGKVIEVKVIDDSYQLLIDNEDGINKADIGNKYQVEARNKTTDILDCNNSFLVQGEEGTGEESAPYKIQYIDDLVELSKNVESGQTFEGRTFVLSRNIDFKNKDSYKDGENSELYTKVTTGTGFTPIGVGDNYFKGNFDGKNHRIDNLYIKNTDGTGLSLGLFGKIEDSTISNLTVSGSIENGTKTANAGMISNVYGTSKVINCTNEINITSECKEWALGGIVATFESSGKDLIIENSKNKGNISGGGHLGGIISGVYTSSGKLTIINCQNEGSLSNASLNMGGIIGKTNAITIIKNSNNNANIKINSNSSFNVGGLIGLLDTNSNTTMSNSNNEGKITINSNSGFSAGGLIGCVISKANINNSHNKNTITSNKTDNIGGRNIGGLVGIFDSTQTSIITNSSNEKTGVISGGNRTGGLVGDSHAGLIMNNCYNLANISSGDTWSSYIDIGGLFGDTNGWSKKHDDIIILNSYNKGNINVSIDNNGSNIGGLIGEQIHSNPSNVTDTSTNTKILNSYNQGNITMNGTTTGALNANGIMGIQEKSIVINNVYNIGILNSTKTNNVIANNNSNVTTDYKNIYYLNTLVGTKPNDTTNVIGKSKSEMKNQTFVTLLNSNKSSIDLSSIDSRLSGYALCDWKLGTSLYPELDCK